jgi:putative SOS response-associated peptidase YedK
MCARYAFFRMHVVADDFGVTPLPDLVPRWNVAPMQFAPVIVSDSEMRMMRWGLLPSWAKDESMASKLLNARGETVAEKPSFRAAFMSRRCIVPTNGFYEWKGPAGSKQPYFITRRSSELMSLAGLWETWSDGVQTLETYTILTTEPNELVGELHTRMPVILGRDDAHAWMESAEAAPALITQYPAEDMEAIPVSREVGKVSVDHPGLIEPAEEQKELF